MVPSAERSDHAPFYCWIECLGTLSAPGFSVALPRTHVRAPKTLEHWAFYKTHAFYRVFSETLCKTKTPSKVFEGVLEETFSKNPPKKQRPKNCAFKNF